MEPQSVIPSPLGSSKITQVPKVRTSRFTGPEVVLEDYTVTRLPPTLSLGQESKGVWKAVSGNEKVQPGDVLRFTYTFRVPFFKEWQTNKFIEKIQDDDRYQLKQWALSDEEGRLWVEVKVIKPDFGITALLVAGAIAAIGVGIGFWLITESIEKLFTFDPEHPGNLTWLFGIAALVIGVPFLLKKV
jgi:hypothetical protein